MIHWRPVLRCLGKVRLCSGFAIIIYYTLSLIGPYTYEYHLDLRLGDTCFLINLTFNWMHIYFASFYVLLKCKMVTFFCLCFRKKSPAYPTRAALQRLLPNNPSFINNNFEKRHVIQISITYIISKRILD